MKSLRTALLIVLALGGCNGGPAPIAFPVEDLACTTSADCCVVYGTCYDRLALVTAKNRDATAAAFAALGEQQQAARNGHQDPDCWGCTPPPIEVSCQAGRCVAQQLTRDFDTPSDLRDPHCGSLLGPDGGAGTKAAVLRSAISLEPKAAAEPPATIGCH
jgi:hypothetical protein